MANPKKKEISVVERRLRSGSVFSAGSRPIPLNAPETWQVRSVNSQISDSRLYDMQAEKGWVYVTPEDLAVKPEEIGWREQDGRIVRGTHGTEVLMKMRRVDYQAVQALKEDVNRKNTFGDKATKSAVLAAAGAEEDGARGAEFLDRAIKKISVVDSVERVSLED